MRSHRKLLPLLGLLALVGIWITLGDYAKPQVPAVVNASLPRKTADYHPSPSRGIASTPEASVTILSLRPRASQEAKPVDAFVFRDWTPPPPEPPPPPPPLPPQAPPLPFVFVGKQLEEGQWVVFLARQDRTYVVRSGDMIETNYQVQQVSPPILTLTYLPLNQTQTLAIGTAE